MESITEFLKFKKEYEITKDNIKNEFQTLTSKKQKLESDLKEKESKLEICSFTKFMIEYNPKEKIFLVVPSNKSNFDGWDEIENILDYISCLWKYNKDYDSEEDYEEDNTSLTYLQKYLTKYIKIVEEAVYIFDCIGDKIIDEEGDDEDPEYFVIDFNKNNLNIKLGSDSNFKETLNFNWIEKNFHKAKHIPDENSIYDEWDDSDEYKVKAKIKCHIYILELLPFYDK